MRYCNQCLTILRQNTKLNYQLAQVSDTIQNRFVEQREELRTAQSNKEKAEQYAQNIVNEITRIVDYVDTPPT